MHDIDRNVISCHKNVHLIFYAGYYDGNYWCLDKLNKDQTNKV